MFYIILYDQTKTSLGDVYFVLTKSFFINNNIGKHQNALKIEKLFLKRNCYDDKTYVS